MIQRKKIFIPFIEKFLKRLNGVNSKHFMKIKRKMIMSNLKSLRGLAIAIQEEKLLMISIIFG